MQQEFAYEGGRFVPAEVVPHASGHPDASGRLDAAGYRPGQAFGDTDGTHYVLWERAAGPEAGARGWWRSAPPSGRAWSGAARGRT